MSQLYKTQEYYKKLLLKHPQETKFIDEMPTEILITVLLKLPHGVFEQIIAHLSAEKMADGLAYAPSNKAKHFINRINSINPSVQNQVLKLLKPKQQQQIKQLLKYASTEVGSFMHLEVLNATVDDKIADVKDEIQHYDSINQHAPFMQLFIISRKEHLLATLDITQLILHQDSENLNDIIEKKQLQKPLMIDEYATINTAVAMFEEFNLSSLAVVDKKGKLLGRILFDDVYIFIRAEEEKQALNMLGTHHQAEKSFGTAQRKRLEWLFINLGAVLLSAIVVNYFRGTIEQFVTLAVLMPIVAALGGDVGNQAVTVTVRRLALGNINHKETFSIISKELFIGIVNGIIIGVVVGVLAYFWFNQPLLGVVVGLAIILNLSIAGLIGSFLPIVLKHFKIDPAIASPLLLTTTTDTMGFFIFLGLASVILL